MAEITTTQAFSDGDTVTATKLNNITANAAIQTEAITNRSAETTVDQANDLLLMYDASATALKKISLSNVIKAGTASNFPVTGNATVGGTLAVTGEITASSTVNGTTIPTSKTLVTTNDTQTLTNKTLTSPVINTGTISGGTINNAVIGGTTAAAGSFTTLSATSPITTQAGTAAAPAIVPTGDTNTGIFFPAADTIAFSEGGTESMRIDSSGRVGIGTASPAYNLDVRGSNNVYLAARATGSANNTTAFIRADTDGVVFGQTGTSATPIIFDQAGTERLRIDSSGRVGIGTSSPAYTLDVSGSAEAAGNFNSTGNTYIGISRSGTRSILLQASSTAGFLYQEANLPFVFGTNNTERLRITSGGEVYIAGTTDQGAYNLQVNGTGVWGAGAYVNGSDERLKENIQDITSGLDVVEKLRPVSFQYKEEYTADRSIQSGFIAQDLLVALEGKNYLEGVVSQGPTYYNVAYQNLIPILAKAIQELKTINNSQAQTITSLESRITALEAA